MSKLLYAMKHKNQYEVEENKRKQAEIARLRREGLFRVALNQQLSLIRYCLDSSDVSGVEVTVMPKSIVYFGMSLGYEEMSEFEITQISKNEYLFQSKELIH